MTFIHRDTVNMTGHEIKNLILDSATSLATEPVPGQLQYIVTDTNTGFGDLWIRRGTQWKNISGLESISGVLSISSPNLDLDIIDNANNLTITLNSSTSGTADTIAKRNSLGELTASAFNGAVSLTTATGVLSVSKGGTGATTVTDAFDTLSPMTLVGDLIIGDTGGSGRRLPGNTTTTKKILTQVGDSIQAGFPEWSILTSSDIPQHPILGHSTAGAGVGTLLMVTSADTLGFVSMSGAATIGSNGALTLSSTGVSAGTYNQVVVGVDGRITSGSTISFNTVRSGSGVPGSGVGVNGDYYINTANSDIYAKSGGTWSLQTSMVGIQGPPGNKITILNEVPGAGNSGTGIAGDLWMDSRYFDLYKRNGTGTTWTSQGSVRGSLIVYGTIEPSSGSFVWTDVAPTPAVKNLDIFINTTTYNVWQYKTSGGWTNIGNIKGATGATGSTGSQGPVGIQGPIGPQGPQGSVAGLSGTAPIDYNTSTNVISIAQATGSVNGYLSSTDWTSFNGKEASLSNPGTDGFLLSSTTAGVRSWVAPYSHPTGDGNLHVPATSTTNNGKFLQAGATAGSLTWAPALTSLPANAVTTDTSQLDITGEKKFTNNLTSFGNGTPGVSSVLIMGAGSPATIPNKKLLIHDTINSYMQLGIQNLSDGTSASSDLVITADTGTDTTNYIDMGINNSTYNDTNYSAMAALDGYFYSASSNLCIGTATTGKHLDIIAGGTTTADVVATFEESGFSSFVPIILPSAIGIQIETGAPALTTDMLYQQNGILYFDGKALPSSVPVFSGTADATVANTTTPTSLLSTGVGSKTLPIDFFSAGKRVKVSLSGTLTNTGTPNIQIQLKLGSTTIIDTTAVAMVTITGTTQWNADFDLVCRTSGATGTVKGHGKLIYYNATTPVVLKDANTGTSVIDTTATQTLDVLATWGTADPANSIVCDIAIIED